MRLNQYVPDFPQRQGHS